MKQDEKLIDEILENGSAQAYHTLVEKYQNSVFTICFKILKQREEAEEVAQDTFIKCFKDLGKLRDHTKFPNWLMKIAYTRSIDKTRKKKLDTVEITAIVEAKSNNQKTPFTETVALNKKEILTSAIHQLEPVEAAVISLYYLEDKPVKEIATITNLSLSNVKIKLFRGRTALRDIITSTFKENIEDLF